MENFFVTILVNHCWVGTTNPRYIFREARVLSVPLGMVYEVVAGLRSETVEFQMAWSFDDTYAFLGLLLDEAVTSPRM